MSFAKEASRVTKLRKNSANAMKGFALVVCDESMLSGGPRIVLEGSWIESWSSLTCQEMARVLGPNPEFTTTEMRLNGGVSVQVLTLVDKGPAKVVVLGKHHDAYAHVMPAEGGEENCILPPAAVEALVQSLNSAISGVSSSDPNQKSKCSAWS